MKLKYINLFEVFDIINQCLFKRAIRHNVERGIHRLENAVWWDAWLHLTRILTTEIGWMPSVQSHSLPCFDICIPNSRIASAWSIPYTTLTSYQIVLLLRFRMNPFMKNSEIFLIDFKSSCHWGFFFFFCIFKIAVCNVMCHLLNSIHATDNPIISEWCYICEATWDNFPNENDINWERI